MFRVADSLSKNSVVIEDPSLDPYVIAKMKEGGYVLYEKVNKEKEYLKTICYPSTFDFALKALASEMMSNGNKYYSSVKEFIGEWRKIEEKLNKLTGV